MNTTPFKAEALKYIVPDQWHHKGFWKQDIFSAGFWQPGFSGDVLVNLGLTINNRAGLVANGGHFFYHKPSIKLVNQEIDERLTAGDLEFLKTYYTDAKQAYEAGIQFAQQTVNDAPLTVEYFNQFLEHGCAMTKYWCLAAVYLCDAVEETLQKKIVEHNLPAEIAPNLLPTFQTMLFDQQKELMELKGLVSDKTEQEIFADSNLFERLEKHTQDYGWIEIANWIGEPLTVKRLIEQISHTKPPTHHETPEVPDDVKVVVEALGYAGYARQAGAEFMSKYEYLTRPYLERLAKQFGLSYKEFIFVSHDEIQELFAGSKTKDDLILGPRQQLRWIYTTLEDGTPLLVEDSDDIDTVNKFMVPQVGDNITEVKGQVGNKGYAKGVVNVIMNVDDFHKFSEGEILVTTMTTPDFVVLMQKAAAIVTDIGGMLCHAAIVSREINKPCVIGTKIATRVFKDGDIVEVDADNGVVSIINS